MTNKEIFESYLVVEKHPFFELADEILSRYCKVFNEHKTSSQSSLWCGCSFEDIHNDKVNYEGEETWRYGGHESHSVSIPIKFFTDTEQAFKDFEEECKGVGKAFNDKRLQQIKDKDLAELARLSSKYS